MDGPMKTYIFFEMGKACRTEYRMRDGEFHATEDAVVIGIERGLDSESAFERLIASSPWLKDYSFDNIVAREIV
jgi:hypothetical protein